MKKINKFFYPNHWFTEMWKLSYSMCSY